jgi:catechol 2,3-dioxygenase-like lactoylglutathione lyase family enzyme
MAITGVHGLFYTPEPDALRATLRDVFGWPSIDAGGGWLIFALPPAEAGVHPAEDASHQISFMCDDITATIAELRAKGIQFAGEPISAGFGVTTTMVLPGDVHVQLYQPRHPTAIDLA